jgi:membrane protein implicated in regulation of membrane protease activity
MILALMFLAAVLLVFFAFPSWPLVVVLLAPLMVLLPVWLASFVWRRNKAAGPRQRRER